MMLHAFALDDADLTRAWQIAHQLLGDDAFALATSPARCTIWRRSDSGWVDDVGDDPGGHADVFELRAASPRGEVRWLHQGDGRGRLVVLGPDMTQPEPHWDDVSIPVVDDIDAQYLLWGSVTGENAAGWSVVGGGRVAPIPVPLDAPAGAMLQLHAREYVSEDEHGNAYVAEELLTRIAVHQGADNDG